MFKDSYSCTEVCLNDATNCLSIKPSQYFSKPSLAKSLPKLKPEVPQRRHQKKSIDLYSIENIANQSASTPFSKLLDFSDDSFKLYSYMDKFDRSLQTNHERFLL
jgi:hypothetical protein